MSTSEAVRLFRLFGIAAILAIVNTDDNLITWPMSALAKHLCDENTKFFVKNFKTFDCNAANIRFTAVAVQIATIEGDTFLNKDATGYGVVFGDGHIKMHTTQRLGVTAEDLDWKYLNEASDSFLSKLFVFLKQESAMKSLTCINSTKNIEFKQDGTYTLTWISEANRSFKVGLGYNSVWLGCPQPLCLDGSVDAVMVKDEDLFVVRGAYVWDISSDTPEQENAWAIQQVKMKVNGATTIPVYFDAGYYNGAFVLISFGTFFTADSKEGPYIETVYVPGLRDVEAAFINKGQLIIIANDGKTKCLRTINDANFTGQQKPPKIEECIKLANDELSQSKISAMFVSDDELYALKGWKYSKLGKVEDFIASKGAVKLNWEYSFLQILKCDTMSYKEWGPTYGFKYYRDYLDIQFNRTRSDVASGHLIALVDLIGLIVLEVVVIMGTLIYWHKYRKESEMGLLSMMSAYKKGGRQGVGARFKRAKMETAELKESKGSKLDVRRSKMSQLDELDLVESKVGGSKKKASPGPGGSKGGKPSKVSTKSSKKASK